MIKGISDVRRLPRLGKIRLGEKKKNAAGKEYPSKLDHFNFKDVPWVAEVYDMVDKDGVPCCKELDIMLPVENPDVFFPQGRKAYRTSGLFCACYDMVTALRVRVGKADGTNPKIAKGTILDPEGEAFLKEEGIDDVKVGEMFEMPCLGDRCSFAGNKFCKGIGRFLFMLPKVPRFGCYEISTTSWNGMVSVNSYIHSMRGDEPPYRRISMLPLKLLLVPKKCQVEGKPVTIFHLEIRYDGTTDSLMTFQPGVKALPAPIPAAGMPKKAELDKEIPDDLMPHGGAALERKLGGQPPEDKGPSPAEQARAKLQEKPAPPAPAGEPDRLDDEIEPEPEAKPAEEKKAEPAKDKPKPAAAKSTPRPARF